MKNRRIVLWVLLALLVAAVAWAIFSKNTLAQAVQEVLGSQPDEPVMKASFVLGPHGFRYYTFNLPPDSKNVSIVADFKVSAADQQQTTAGNAQKSGSEIEVYVFSELTFSDWQRGAPSNPVFASGAVGQGNFHQPLPPGQGTYYIVFSNRADPETSGKIAAQAYLHHRSWLHR